MQVPFTRSDGSQVNSSPSNSLMARIWKPYLKRLKYLTQATHEGTLSSFTSKPLKMVNGMNAAGRSAEVVVNTRHVSTTGPCRKEVTVNKYEAVRTKGRVQVGSRRADRDGERGRNESDQNHRRHEDEELVGIRLEAHLQWSKARRANANLVPIIEKHIEEEFNTIQ
jgi:hypothetical protein